MPQISPYELHFRGALRIGTRGLSQEEAGAAIPSDTLFAALVDAFRRSGGSANALVAPFCSQPPDPPFLLTSAFPFAGGVRFFPVPVDLARLLKPEAIALYGKQVKRIKYLSEGLLQRALQGEKLDAYLFPKNENDEPTAGAKLQGGLFWLGCDELDQLPKGMQRQPRQRHSLRLVKVWQAERIPHVTVDRIQAAPVIFHAGRITFSEGCGLWFGVEWKAPDRLIPDSQLTYQEAFLRALSLLQDDGLGGDRSVGNGAFTINAGQEPPAALNLPDAAPGLLAYLLSRYHPGQAELPQALTLPGTAYQLVNIAGWARSPDAPAQRRKRVTLVAEGSLVYLPGLPPGELADVTPSYTNPEGELPHRVYRMGLALAAGWRGEEAEHA